MTVCWHAGFGPIRASQSVGSMVSHLRADVQTHFLTGTSAPCTSIFKPVWLDADLPDMGPSPAGAYDGATLFWQHEVLHRATLRDYATRSALYQDERDEMERCFISGAFRCDDREAYAARCFGEAHHATRRWIECVQSAKVEAPPPVLHRLAWRNFNRQAKMPPSALDYFRQDV